MPDFKTFLQQAKAKEAKKASLAEERKDSVPEPPKKRMSVRGMRPDMYHMLTATEDAKQVDLTVASADEESGLKASLTIETNKKSLASSDPDSSTSAQTPSASIAKNNQNSAASKKDQHSKFESDQEMLRHAEKQARERLGQTHVETRPESKTFVSELKMLTQADNHKNKVDLQANPLNSPIGAVSSAQHTPTSDTQNSESDDFRASPKSTDTVPTQSRHNKLETEALKSSSNTDTIPTQPNENINASADTKAEMLAAKCRHSADTVPTQIGASVSDIIANDVQTHDYLEKVSTQNSFESRHNTDTTSYSENAQASKNTGTVPTQDDDVAAPEKVVVSAIEPTQYQHSTGTNGSRHKKYRHSTNTEPTRSLANTNTIPTPNPTQDFRQTGLSTDTNLSIESEHESKFKLLRGLKLQLMDYCAKECIRFNSSSLRSTYEALAVSTGIPEGSIRTTTKRLRDEGLLNIYAPNKGPGAFVELVLPDAIIRFAARTLLGQPTKTDTIPTQVNQKSRHNTDTQSDTNASSSSRELYLNTPTTHAHQLDPEWLESLDLSDVAKFGITYDVILRAKQLTSAISEEDLEDLIFRFGLYAKDPKNGVKNARGFFLSLAKQVGQGVVPLDHIETPRERFMRESVERKKHVDAQRAEIEREFWEHQFNEWLARLSPEQRDTLVPPNGKEICSGNIGQRTWLKKIFDRDERPRLESEFEKLNSQGNA